MKNPSKNQNRTVTPIIIGKEVITRKLKKRELKENHIL